MNAPAVSSPLARMLVVLRKEIVDSLRDRRTLLVSLLTAAAAGPIFLLLIFNLIASQADRARELKLPVVGIEHAPALAAFLERQQVTLSTAPDDYVIKLKTGDLDVVLVVDPDFADDVAAGKPATVRLAADHSRDRARASIRQAENLLAPTTASGERSGCCCVASRPRWAIRWRSRSRISPPRSVRGRSSCSWSPSTACWPR